jgi:AcrR family transcriptional regulator
MRDEGLDKVTMRRIAAALDTGPASLYVYVRNTEDLHAQILDALLAPVTAPSTGTWRDRLKALLLRYAAVLFDHPGIARMAMSTQPSGENYLALVNEILALLVEGGASVRGAAWGVDLLLLYPTAVAVEHSAPRFQNDEVSALAARLAAVDAARYPHIARLSEDIVSGTGNERADWALDVLLDGILASAPTE